VVHLPHTTGICPGVIHLQLRIPLIAKYSLLPILFLYLTFDPASAEIRFEDVSEKAGIAYTSPTVGASWGDFNGDGFPDLFVPNHRLEGNTSNLFVNQRDGTFVDVASTVLSVSPLADLHGAAWADFDNDGDQDLIATAGGGGGKAEIDYPKHLFVNAGGILRNEAKRLGVDYPLGRGRTPLWLDVDNDGSLDVLLMNVPRPDKKAPSVLFRQSGNTFKDANLEWGFRDAPWSRSERLHQLLDNIIHLSWRQKSNSLSFGNDRFAQLADLTGDDRPELIIFSQPTRVYSMDTIPMRDITNRVLFPNQTFVQDVVIDDFDGDGRNDIFLVRSRPGRWTSYFATPKPVIQTNPLEVKGMLAGGDIHGAKLVRFKTEGDVTLRLYPPWTPENERETTPPQVRIGSTVQPADLLSFTVSPTDAALTAQEPDGAANSRKEIALTFDKSVSNWVLRSTARRIDFVLNASEPIDHLQLDGFQPTSGELPNILLLQRGGQFINHELSAEVGTPVTCHSAVAGDFDNDMDLDLFLVCAGAVENLPNRLYENHGKGNFRLVPDAGGARSSQQGRGDVVVTADYDGDGFLDLFVTNGAGLEPFGNGPHQLFHNRGNGNHWIEIDLEGVTSNRDGIGASVELEAGGVVQRREQRGGMHGYAQNHQRLHFGLAGNTQVNWIVVRWPSGHVQRLTTIQADQIYRIRESTGQL
jgi:ASPIC/UnbV protein/VCBS repeat protein